MADFALTTGILAALVAIPLLASTHYLTRELWGRLHRVLCYAIGTLLIAIVYGAWCIAQPAAIPGAWAFIAFVGVVAGAGIGTGLAYVVDSYAGTRRENKLLRAKDDDADNR